jgi:hypothetical protein
VDGVNAMEHLKRVLPGGKYSNSLINNSKYALIDFRVKVEPKDRREHFYYVKFDDEFQTAQILTYYIIPERYQLRRLLKNAFS